jgi:hypothetical protein
MKQRYKKILDPFDKLFCQMKEATFEKVAALDERGIKELEEALDSLTTTNCGWTVYAMREHIRDAITGTRKHVEK